MKLRSGMRSQNVGEVHGGRTREEWKGQVGCLVLKGIKVTGWREMARWTGNATYWK